MSETKNGSSPSTVNTQGGAYIGGSVNTGGGKLVGRDDFSVCVQQGATREEFLQVLAAFRAALPEAGLPERQARVIEGDVRTVEEEAAEKQPDAGIIQAKIDGITGILGKIGGASDAAGGTLDKLVSLGTRLGELAAQAFS
jgi:hypothetical protein